MNLVEITNLSKHFSGVKAVSDISFNIEEKTINVVIGPNGGGKADFLQALAGEKQFADHLPAEHVQKCTPVLAKAQQWLDVYFSAKEPDFIPPLHPVGSAFRQEVWQRSLILRSMPPA